MDQDATCVEVGLGSGHIVLDGDPTSPRHSSPHFSAHFALARSPISATAGLLFVLMRRGETVVKLEVLVMGSNRCYVSQ